MNGDERYKSTWIPGLGWKIGHKLWLGIYQKWCESNIFGHVYIYIFIYTGCLFIHVNMYVLYLDIFIYPYIYIIIYYMFYYIILYHIILYHMISYFILYYYILTYLWCSGLFMFFFCICCVSSTTTKNFRSDGWNARWARSGLVAPWAPSWWKNRWTT